MDIAPEPKTKSEALAKANHWLNKAVALEDEGKSAKMVEMAFKKAVGLENKAFELAA